MRLEYYPQEKLRREILTIVGKHLELKEYRVFFFGSRVTGRGNDRSDIDVGIEGPRSVPLGVLATIQEEVSDLPTLYKIDIVDFTRVSPDFRDVALEKIEYFERA